MWALELQHVDTVVDAIKDRNGRHAVVDTIIYSLMSLRQNQALANPSRRPRTHK
jgi:hypothetical protein